jgi:hypothetical protein
MISPKKFHMEIVSTLRKDYAVEIFHDLAAAKFIIRLFHLFWGVVSLLWDCLLSRR